MQRVVLELTQYFIVLSRQLTGRVNALSGKELYIGNQLPASPGRDNHFVAGSHLIASIPPSQFGIQFSCKVVSIHPYHPISPHAPGFFHVLFYRSGCEHGIKCQRKRNRLFPHHLFGEHIDRSADGKAELVKNGLRLRPNVLIYTDVYTDIFCHSKAPFPHIVPYIIYNVNKL